MHQSHPNLEFPADHGQHLTINNEWVFLVSLLDIEGGGSIALVTMMMRYGVVSPPVSSTLPGNTLGSC
jgi:hypothetical protein